MARDQQDRAALEKMAAECRRAAAKAPNDAEAQYRAALATSYLAEVAIELHDRKAGRQAAEHGIKAAEKAVALKPADAEYYRVLGTLYGQAITDLMSGLKYGPKAKDAINKAVEKAPKSSIDVRGARRRQLLPARPARRRRQARHPRFPEGHRTRSHQCRSLPLAGPQPAQRESRRRGAPGLRQVAGTQPQPRLDQTAVGKDAGEMKPLATAAACAALALLTFFQFPGHTWLQQDTQIYVPILEHLRDPAVLRNDILVQQPHVAFTLYDETALALRAVTGPASARCSPSSRSSPARSVSGDST